MSKPVKSKNEVCEQCLKWDQFQEACHVFWEGKKECTQKVRDMGEWNELDRFLK